VEPRDKSLNHIINEQLRVIRKAVDWLLYSKEELRLRARDERLLKIMRHGKTTIAQMFAADFGTDNPNGLDIKYQPRGDIEIKSFF
jgi:hypothetical protein